MKKNITIKKLITALLFILLLSTLTINGQHSKNNFEQVIALYEPIKPSTLETYSYKAIYNDGKVYLTWVPINQDECIYTIQRSQDGKDFKNIGYKSGYGVLKNNSIKLMYCFVDSVPLKGESYYRIQCINLNFIVNNSISKRIKNSLE